MVLDLAFSLGKSEEYWLGWPLFVKSLKHIMPNKLGVDEVYTTLIFVYAWPYIEYLYVF